MKITTTVSLPDQDVELNIDGLDVVTAILEGAGDRDAQYLIKRMINDVGTFLNRLPDAEIEKLGEPVRGIIADFLERQVIRFRQK